VDEFISSRPHAAQMCPLPLDASQFSTSQSRREDRLPTRAVVEPRLAYHLVAAPSREGAVLDFP
jgi:hypothetical protein